MKIGLVCPYHLGSFGGVQQQVLEWSQQLKKLGHESLVLTCGPEVNLQRKDIVFLGKHFPFPVNDSIGTLSYYLENDQPLKNFLAEKQFDLLHFHAPLVPFLSWQLLSASQTVNVATFHSFREMRLPQPKLGGSFALQRKDSASLESLDTPALLPSLRSGCGSSHQLKAGSIRLEAVVISTLLRTLGWPVKAYIRSRLTKKVKKFSAVSPAAAALAQDLIEEIEIIPNAINLSRFSKAKGVKKFDDDKINLLCVGTLSKRKGVIYLLKSIEKLTKKSDSFRLIIVGKGPEEKKLKTYVKLRRIKNVVFVGSITSKQLPSYFASADIFCAPATHGESFGVVLLEAMASGLPIVAFANKGYKNILKNRPFSNFLIAPKDTKGFSLKLEKLITSRKLRNRLSRAGLAEVQKYSWENVGKRLLKFYQEAQES